MEDWSKDWGEHRETVMNEKNRLSGKRKKGIWKDGGSDGAESRWVGSSGVITMLYPNMKVSRTSQGWENISPRVRERKLI